MTYWLYKNERSLDPYKQSTLKDHNILTDDERNENVKDKFEDFLERTKNVFVRLDGYNTESDSYKVRFIPLLHRWKPEYINRILAKTYALKDWYESYVPRLGLTMVTFTTEQKGKLIPDQIEDLKVAFNKIKKVMNHYLGKFPYLWVIEPHPSSGYCHLHMLYFGNRIPRFIKEKINDLWIKKYKVARHYVNFEYSKHQRSLNNAGGYAFKYLSKTMNEKILTDRDSSYYLFASWVREMSCRDSNYKGVRMWGCSRELSEVMKYEGKPSPVICFRVCLKMDTGWFPLWVSPDLWGAAGDRVIQQFDSWLNSLSPDDGVFDPLKVVISL